MPVAGIKYIYKICVCSACVSRGGARGHTCHKFGTQLCLFLHLKGSERSTPSPLWESTWNESGKKQWAFRGRVISECLFNHRQQLWGEIPEAGTLSPRLSDGFQILCLTFCTSQLKSVALWKHVHVLVVIKEQNNSTLNSFALLFSAAFWWDVVPNFPQTASSTSKSVITCVSQSDLQPSLYPACLAVNPELQMLSRNHLPGQFFSATCSWQITTMKVKMISVEASFKCVHACRMGSSIMNMQHFSDAEGSRMMILSSKDISNKIMT